MMKISHDINLINRKKIIHILKSNRSFFSFCDKQITAYFENLHVAQQLNPQPTLLGSQVQISRDNLTNFVSNTTTRLATMGRGILIDDPF